MGISENIKNLSYKERRELNQYLNNLIRHNKLTEIKYFLKDYPVEKAFYEALITNADGKQISLFNPVTILVMAAQIAKRTKNLTMLDYFFEYGLKADYTNDSGMNVLTDYIDSGGENEEIIKLFIQKGAKFDTYDKSGWTMLHFWAKKQAVRKLEIAIKFGADINIRTKENNQTPLIFAASSDYRPVGTATEMLIKLGADVNLSATEDGKAYTALDKAYGHKNKTLLKEAGAKTYAETQKS
ncbi:ankyrin repeat domain-containing protein [Helicobacter sp. MIT 05-5293]|uniref:ankyrin repeat domain-containing protein n=1 Tax=Helicobacter sp. MIT 05-5293 TaxID=1548149 RepID=UPI00068C0F5C|nr:ankyrin repeat domain-containing protein [Helicobacter sp. MIT 05-5293]TLD79930.1 ankyrin repeat domain-containing protein [Helicobacter sp. MIT 05-5293]